MHVRWFHHWLLALLACGVGAAAACTESHDTQPDYVYAAGRAGGGRGGATAGRAGTGGAGGRAGTAGRGSGSAGSGTGATRCGGNTCVGLSFAGLTLPACCVQADTCGIDLAGTCTERGAAGELDDDCPSQSLFGVLTLPGCCRTDGTCGAMDSFVGLGCVSLGGPTSTRCGS
ncbi:MAG: hypothetical protein ABW321_13760 [Polyangiales bacterium]